MKKLSATRSVWFDVDDTLVIWGWREVDPEGKGLVSIVNPDNGVAELVLPHFRHIELMRQFAARGHTVWVWSQGGADWAEAVCRVLGIENLVSYVVDKPNWYVDDLHASTWMRSPIYLDPTDPSKDSRWGAPGENKGN